MSEATELRDCLEDVLEDVEWLDENAAGRRAKDDEAVWDKLSGMRARIKARLEQRGSK